MNETELGALAEMRGVLIRVETKLDTALTRVEDHETRIRKVERAVWIAAGVASAGGGGIGAIASSFIAG